MTFGSNVTPKRFGVGAIRDNIAEAKRERKEFEPTWEKNLEPDPEPIPNLPVHLNDIYLNDCYRCGHRGTIPVPGCDCCKRDHQYAPPDPED